MKIINTLTQPQFQNHLKQASISHGYYQTPAGLLCYSMTELGIYEAFFCDVKKNQSHAPLRENITLLLVGTEFQIKVWRAIASISSDNPLTYHDLALTIGHPHAWRAVANALAQNKIAYFIPCHRVIRKNGQLGGYKWGIEKKAALLATL